jgi:hypothetical protein
VQQPIKISYANQEGALRGTQLVETSYQQPQIIYQQPQIVRNQIIEVN